MGSDPKFRLGLGFRRGSRFGTRIGTRKPVRIGFTAGRQQPIVKLSEPGGARYRIASARNCVPDSRNCVSDSGNRVSDSGISFTGTGHSVSKRPLAWCYQSTPYLTGTWR
jgi:hypothetical protein